MCLAGFETEPLHFFFPGGKDSTQFIILSFRFIVKDW